MITIEYCAVANGSGKGHLPALIINGHRRGSTYASTGYTESEALTMARELAEAEASRHVGDWDVVVREL